MNKKFGIYIDDQLIAKSEELKVDSSDQWIIDILSVLVPSAFFHPNKTHTINACQSRYDYDFEYYMNRKGKFFFRNKLGKLTAEGLRPEDAEEIKKLPYGTIITAKWNY